MTEKKYIIDGDNHLLGGTAKSGKELVDMYWRLDQEGALLFADEYEGLRRELDRYEGQPDSDLDAYRRWRLDRLRTFFVAHPNPPPAPKDQP
jgi:hypothetical protein